MLQLIDVGKTYRIGQTGLLRPRYRVVDALRDVNLNVAKGETLAILGPNGAGKSTICKIAAGMTKPSTGLAVLDGKDITRNVKDVSKHIGVVLGPTLIYYRLTGYEYLRFFAKIYEVKDYELRIKEICKRVNIDKSLSAFIESYSLGMKMRISMARALLHEPEFLVLDEFTMGLDPVSARGIRQMVKELGRTVLLTTHNTVEAEIMADRVAFISTGRIVATDTVRNLVRAIQDKTMLVFSAKNNRGIKSTLAGVDNVSFHESENGQFELVVQENELPELLKILAKHDIDKIQTKEPNLEEAYVYFTGQKLTEDL